MFFKHLENSEESASLQQRNRVGALIPAVGFLVPKCGSQAWIAPSPQASAASRTASE
jgi:hypothetical protein